MERTEPGAETGRAYWEKVSAQYVDVDPLGAVCIPGAPPWLNRFVAGLQRRTLERALDGISLTGIAALDVGCGVGRWTRWLRDRGAAVVGVDATPGMLEAARRLSPDLDFRCMSATRLELPDASFDLVVCVTVLQHLKRPQQEAAIKEIARVLRPGGRLVALEMIDLHDCGRVEETRSAGDWIEAHERHGLRLEGWRGQEYVPLIRAFRAVAERAARLIGIEWPQAQVAGLSLLEQTRARRRFHLAYAALWCLVQLSRPLEPLCEALLPGEHARHACFVFRKPL